MPPSKWQRCHEVPSESSRGSRLSIRPSWGQCPRVGTASPCRMGAGVRALVPSDWKIVNEAWYEIFAKAGLERVFTIVLRLDAARHEVRAPDREWRVTWEVAIPTLAPGDIDRYRFAKVEIKGPLQKAVTGCRWTWRSPQNWTYCRFLPHLRRNRQP